MIKQVENAKIFVGDQEVIGDGSFKFATEEAECPQCLHYKEDESGNLNCWPIVICVNKSKFERFY